MRVCGLVPVRTTVQSAVWMYVCVNTRGCSRSTQQLKLHTLPHTKLRRVLGTDKIYHWQSSGTILTMTMPRRGGLVRNFAPKSCRWVGWLSGSEVESPLCIWRRGGTLPGALGAVVHLGSPPTGRLDVGVLNHSPGFSGLSG
jgi:hypothetical protein